MEKVLFPMKNVSISRRAFKPGTTHTNLNAIDINGEDKTNRYHRMFSDNPEGWGVSPCYDSNGQYANSRIIVTKIHGIKGEI